MSNTKIWIISIVLIILAILVYLLWPVLGMFLVAAFIAYLLTPFNNFLQKKLKIHRGFTTAIVSVIVIAAAAALVGMVMPIIIEQGSALFNNLDDYALQATQFIENIGQRMQDWNLPKFITDYFNELDIPKFIMSKAQELAGANTISSIIGSVTGTIGVLANILFVIIVSIYLLYDWNRIMQWIRSHIPERAGETIERIAKNADIFVWRFLRAQLIIAAVVAVISWIGFAILGVEYALLLAIITFFLNFIPYFGSIFAGVLVTLVALFTGGALKALYVLIFIIVVQQVEGNIFAPKISGSSVNMHPVIVLFALLACHLLFGAFGMFIAVPLACVVRLILVEMNHFLKKIK